jgi:hypothetical protein
MGILSGLKQAAKAIEESKDVVSAADRAAAIKAAAAANKQVQIAIDNIKKDTGVQVTTSGGNFGTLALIVGAAFLLGKL